MDLGERLKNLRAMRGLTLADVGNHLGVNKATVQRYESGDIDIKRNIAIKLAEILNVSPSYIMGWTDNIFSDGDATFSENLRKARLKKQLTPKQVMDIIGVPSTTYADYEDGRLQPDISTIIALSKLLDVSTDELFGIAPRGPGLHLTTTETQVVNNFRVLNAEGQEKVVEYIDDLVASHKYIKNNSPEMGMQAN